MMIATLRFEPRKFCKATNCRKLLESTSNKGKVGSVSRRSAKRISRVSIPPPEIPATAPMTVPTITVKAVVISATSSEYRPA
jgi:hypothetical protein